MGAVYCSGSLYGYVKMAGRGVIHSRASIIEPVNNLFVVFLDDYASQPFYIGQCAKRPDDIEKSSDFISFKI